MSLLDEILKEWDKFDFSLEPTKERMRDFLIALSALEAHSIALESLLISYLSKMRNEDKQKFHEEFLELYGKFYAEISAKRIAKLGR